MALASPHITRSVAHAAGRHRGLRLLGRDLGHHRLGGDEQAGNRCRALQDAASIAGLLITTEAMVAERPKEAAPAMPPGGGMGGMGGKGGMDF